jgi:hypothetical protein
MQKKFLLLLVTVSLAACQQQGSAPSETASTKHQAQNDKEGSVAGPVKFELRDFQLDEQKQSYGGAMYKGRGTLVIKDPSVARGNYMVWLTVKQAHKNDEPAKILVLVHDGIGTVETHDYLTKDELEKTKVKYVNWEVLGYVPMSAGTIVTDTVAAQPK